MIDDVIHSGTAYLLKKYLSPLDCGNRTVDGVYITVRTVTGYRVPSDAKVVRLLIEGPDEGWAVAFEVVERCGKLYRLRLERYYDDEDALGPNGARELYAEWLSGL